MSRTRNPQTSYLTASHSNKTPNPETRVTMVDSLSKLAGLEGSFTDKSIDEVEEK